MYLVSSIYTALTTTVSTCLDIYTADCSTAYRPRAEVDSHMQSSSVHRRWIVDWYNGIKYICRNDAIHDDIKLLLSSPR